MRPGDGERGLWFVVYTQKGREYKILQDIQKNVARPDERLFLFENEMQYKVKGEWITDRKPFFPGYIFVETGMRNAVDFNGRLRKWNYGLKLMSVEGDIMPIRPEEQEYLLLLGGEEHVIYHSAGFRVNDRVEITSGSFAGYTGEIRKLDRHNRRARVCLPLMGRLIEVEIGLEIVKNITGRADGLLTEDTRNMAKIVPAI